MDNRYLQYLQETLRAGVDHLRAVPFADEVEGISRRDFDVLISAFHQGLYKLDAGLTKDFLSAFPQPSSGNPKYYEGLAKQIDQFTNIAGETETQVLGNMPPLAGQKAAYEQALRQRVEIAAAKERKGSWKQQLELHNQNIIHPIRQQIEESLPSIANNKEIVSDLTQKVIDKIETEALSGVESPSQTKEIVARAVAEVLKTEASGAKEIAESSSAAEQIAIQIAEAEEQNTISGDTPSLWDIKEQRSLSDGSFADLPYNQILSTVETAVRANLGPDILKENPNLAKEVGQRVADNIAPSLKNLTPDEIQIRIAQEIKVAIATAKITQETAANISASTSQGFIPRPRVTTPLANWPGPSGPPETLGQTVPTIPPETLTEAASPPGAENAASLSVSSGLGGVNLGGYAPEGFLRTFQSHGMPAGSLLAVVDPRSGLKFGEWILHGGFIKDPFWYVAGEIFGRPDWIDVSFMSMDIIKRELDFALNDQFDKDGNLIHLGLSKQVENAKGLDKYVLNRELREAKMRLGVYNELKSAIDNNPIAKMAYDRWYGAQGKFFGLGLRNIFHPFQSINNALLRKNLLLGLGANAITDSLLALRWGPMGFSYVSTEWIKMFGIALVKELGMKVGLYEIRYVAGGMPHYVFKPTEKIKDGIKYGLNKIGGKIWGGIAKTGAGRAISKTVDAVKKLFSSLLAKLGLSLVQFLSVIGLFLGTLGWLWNKTKKLLGLATAWIMLMIAQHGLWAAGGFLVGLIGGQILAIKLALATFGALFPFIGPFAAIPAAVVWFGTTVVTIVGGTAIGVWAHGLLGDIGGSFSNMLTNFGTLPNFGPTFSGYVAPVLGITGATVIGGTMLTQMITSSAFWIPEQSSQIQSQYIKISKTPSFSGKIGDTIEYSVTVTSLKNSLTNIKISDNITFHCRENPPSVPAINYGAMPQEIAAGGSYTFKYEISSYTTSRLNDCLVVNSATVTADVKDGPTGEQGLASASVSIGNPPFEYPSGWPVATGCITQGPNTTKSHAGDQAIDIGAPTSGGSLLGAAVLATHKGPVSLTFKNHTIYGNYVIVDGSAEKSGFQTLYAHLDTIAVSKGQSVNKGTKIGSVGNTGNSEGPHLHYEFRGLVMGPPYLGNGNITVPACVEKKSKGGNCDICF